MNTQLLRIVNAMQEVELENHLAQTYPVIDGECIHCHMKSITHHEPDCIYLEVVQAKREAHKVNEAPE